MKKYLLALFAITLWNFSNAQLVLQRAVNSQQGTPYFEISNKGISSQNLDCYTLVSYYSTTTERGFYIINLPRQDLPSRALLSISLNEMSRYNPVSNHATLSLRDLYQAGYLQRLVLSEIEKRYLTSSEETTLPHQVLGITRADEHLVLLFNNNQLVDASYTVNDKNQLSRFFSLLPNLSFTNPCNNLVTVRFGTLQNLYTHIFNRPNTQRTYGEFSEVEIRRNDAQVQIAWQTQQEQNTRGFEIERRWGNEPWTTVAYVATLAPAGARGALNYLYADQPNFQGQVEYRLRQIDMNGRSVYSPAQTINMRGEESKVVVFPNPSPDGRVNIAFGNVNSLRDVQVIDYNGQLVQQWVAVNNSTQQLNTLRSGNYVVRVFDRQTGAVHSQKLLVRSH